MELSCPPNAKVCLIRSEIFICIFRTCPKRNDCLMLILDPSFCIKVQSNDQNCYSGSWTGSPISLKRNNIEVSTLAKGFENFNFCLPQDQVDLKNDVFTLTIQGRDGVSISYLKNR